ncbi:hypothetical protein [Bacillus badius]|nr:hypothetical protein [Bacillus badius]MED0668042.1 hypothetical protein [Bacillus badius]MED4717820.1 hypothetical protein [Bacillus badius]TDV99676.1 hypothetical protein B0G66_12136 [Bacillus badius]UAT32972.1 hypothetical protein K7T73_20235 [Bacillus badius]GLY11996.1 hypothetical protein Bbad01_32120 [Bacillus badius]
MELAKEYRVKQTSFKQSQQVKGQPRTDIDLRDLIQKLKLEIQLIRT